VGQSYSPTLFGHVFHEHTPPVSDGLLDQHGTLGWRQEVIPAGTALPAGLLSHAEEAGLWP
jgi:hypothetical protein